MAEVAQNIAFDVIARDKASATFSKISKSSEATESRLTKFGKKAALVLGGVGIGTGLVSLFKDANAEAREAQKVGALTTSTIKATGGAANVTAKQVGNLATSISNKVGVDDEAIQAGENMLLTFKNIRNEAGRGNKIFNQAARTTTDLAAAMAAASGGELNFRSASIQMGKALNDPVKGITALSRVGVTFTDQQKEQIKTLVKSGNIMGAQKIILKELRSEFGGAAAAQATAGDKARVAWKNLEEQIGTALLPVVDDLANRLTDDVIPAVSEFITQMQNGTGAGGEFVHDLKETVDVGKDVVGFFTSLPGPVKKYGVELVVAAVALNKINNGLVAGRTAFTNWAASFGTANATMTRTQKAAYGLGVGLRNLGGAGGMVAVVDGAKRGNKALGALETTAGAAAVGFAVGGPLGAGIGATAGGLFSLYKALNTSTREVKVSLPPWQQYAETLDGVAASTTKATREMVYQRLQQSGLLEATEKLGLSDRQAVAAMMGNAAQRKRLSDALRNQNVLTKEQESALRKETGALGSSRLAQLQKNVATARGKDEVNKAREALRKFMAEPASKRVSIVGVEDAKAQLSSLRVAIEQVWAKAKDAHVAGSGGLDVLLNPSGSGSRTAGRAMGGPVVAGQPYVVGERRPELFVPSTSGRVVPQVSGTATVAPTSHVEMEQAFYRAISRALSDSGAIVVPKRQLDALDLMVGVA